MGEHINLASAYGFFLTKTKVSFLNVLQPYKITLFWGCLLLFATNSLVALLPSLINAGVILIEKGKPHELNLYFHKTVLPFFPLLTLIVVMAAVAGVLRTLSRKVIFDVGRTIERDVRQRLFFHLSTMDDDFFHNHGVGDAMNHLTSDMANIRMVTGFATLNLMNIILVFLFAIPLLFRIDWLLACCALTPFPLIILATSGITKRMFQATIDYQRQLGELISHVQENLLGAHIVRLFHQQHHENQRFAVTNQKTYDAGIRLARVRVLTLPVMRLMVGLAVGLVLYVGGLAVTTGRISLGDFVEINARILQLAWPAMSVGFVMSVLSRGQASLARVNKILAHMPKIQDGQHVLTGVNTIDVRNLPLKRESAHPETISFKIERGELLGVVGPSGSYKSTLLRALSRRFIVPEGSIFLDGHDINSISLSSLYQHMSVVLEDSFLFHKSIKDNICFARPESTDDEIKEVITLLRLDRDLSNFHDGINTVIGERGITLSGGQRQRIALARALLAKRPIIILDDALSSVDADTERYIVHHLRDYLHDSLVIIATHRLSAIRDANQILVMDKGVVVETGNHRHLMKNGLLYQQLWGFDHLQGLWS